MKLACVEYWSGSVWYCIACILEYKWAHAYRKFESDQNPRLRKWRKSRLDLASASIRLKPPGVTVRLGLLFILLCSSHNPFYMSASPYMPGGGGTCFVNRQ